MCGYVGLYRANLGLTVAVLGWLGLCRTGWGCKVQCEAVRYCVGLCGTVRAVLSCFVRWLAVCICTGYSDFAAL